MLVFAYFNDRLIELGLLFFAYINLRYLFPTTFHHKTMKGCLSWSIVMMFVSIQFSQPIGLTIMFNLVIGFLMGYVLYRTQLHIDIKKELELIKIKQSKTLYEMTIEEFNEFCKSKGLNPIEIKIAELFIREHKSGSEIAYEIGFSVTHVKRKRIYIKEVLQIV